VLADDFLAGGTVDNATIASRELYGPQFSRAMVRLETLDHFWAGKGRLDAAKVDIEGYETKFLRGGRKTIASHRAVILMEVNRWHHEKRGVDFDTVIRRCYQIGTLLPNCGPGASSRSTISRNAPTRTF